MLIRHQAGRLTSTTTLLMATIMLLAGCGGGGGGGSGDMAPAPVPSSSASSSSASSLASSSLASSASSSSSSTASSVSSSSASSVVSLYITEPVIASCDVGVLKASERTVVLDKVNAIRARHGLLPLAYDASDDNAAAQAAMYMVANKTLTSAPNSGGLCYTADAARLAGTSNLYVYLTPASTTQNVPGTQAIVSYLVNNGVGSLGLRRRLLNPFLGKTTYGRVDGQPAGTSFQYMSSVLKVVGNDVSDISAMSNDFVAYPYGVYPASEFATDWYLSFSAIASKTNAASNGNAQVNFSGATITIMDGVTPLTVTDQATDYAAYGLPNSLQWKVIGLQPNVSYSVRIDNVIVNGLVRQYNYSFTLQ